MVNNSRSTRCFSSSLKNAILKIVSDRAVRRFMEDDGFSSGIPSPRQREAVLDLQLTLDSQHDRAKRRWKLSQWLAGDEDDNDNLAYGAHEEIFMPYAPAPDPIQANQSLGIVLQPHEARCRSIAMAVPKPKRRLRRRLASISERALDRVIARGISKTRRLDIKARRLFKHEKTSTAKLEMVPGRNKLRLVVVKSRIDGTPCMRPVFPVSNGLDRLNVWYKMCLPNAHSCAYFQSLQLDPLVVESTSNCQSRPLSYEEIMNAAMIGGCMVFTWLLEMVSREVKEKDRNGRFFALSLVPDEPTNTRVVSINLESNDAFEFDFVSHGYLGAFVHDG